MKISSLPVGMIGTNCYILCDEQAKVCAIIDPGDWASQIRTSVEKTGCTPTMILLTHGHYDHTTAVRPLLESWPALPVYIHQKETCPADTKAAQYQFPLLGEENQRFYDEGDTLTLGSLTIRVMHTPGHSPGSVVLRVDEVLFTGDTLFASSCGRIDLSGGDPQAMMDSLRRLGSLEGDLLVHPGHMESTSLDVERKGNYYVKIALRG